jgi:hypothetical protein
VQVIWPKPNRVFGIIDALGLLGFVGLLVARFIPVAKIIPFWGCMFRQTTGWPCPGCGLTRVADRISHGNVVGAFDANPLGAVAAIVLATLAVVSALHLAFKLPIPEVVLSQREGRWLRIGLGVAIAVNYAFVIVNTKFPTLL